MKLPDCRSVLGQVSYHFYKWDKIKGLGVLYKIEDFYRTQC